ncbi:DUF3040 domain-containing protein [Arthrobacter pigmenti]
MALSEYERHELARLEEQLGSDDPPQSGQSWPASRVEEAPNEPLVFGLMLIAVGAALLLVGVVATAVIVALSALVVAVIGAARRVAGRLGPHTDSFGQRT